MRNGGGKFGIHGTAGNGWGYLEPRPETNIDVEAMKAETLSMCGTRKDVMEYQPAHG